jgi:DNA-directed RNA polymerase subunit RPC12/RpoP
VSLIIDINTQNLKMSQKFSGSGGGSERDLEEEMEDDQAFNIYGMYFCGACKNIMTPLNDMGEKLDFRCKLCDKKTVDFTDSYNDQCIIYNKELKPGTYLPI